MPLQVGAVPDPGSHVCRGWLTLPFSPDWGQGHQLSDGQHTQTNRLQASLIVRPGFCLSSIVFIVMTSIQSPLSLVVEGEVPRAPTLCHQAVACWCNRAPPQARATFTRVLPPPLLPPMLPQQRPPFVCPVPKLFVFLPIKISLGPLNKLAKAIRPT